MKNRFLLVFAAAILPLVLTSGAAAAPKTPVLIQGLTCHA